MHALRLTFAALFAVASLAVALAVSCASTASANGGIVVFAAASLKNAMDDVTAAWKQKTGHSATVAVAGSARLARQIQQGAPADVFISANVKWMDALQDDHLIDPATRRDLLGNRLVLIAHGRSAPSVVIDKNLDLKAMLKRGKLAMAMVDAVPAGIYGKAALTTLGLWTSIAPHVAQTDNVRAALALVARGEAPYGIVYATDATASDNVTVVATFPPELHPPVIYPIAVTTRSRHKGMAQKFLDFLATAQARSVFEHHGFRAIAAQAGG